MIEKLKKELKEDISNFQDINRLKESNNVEQSLHFNLGAITALKQVLVKMDHLVKDDMALIEQIGYELKYLIKAIEAFKKYPRNTLHPVLIRRHCDDLRYYSETLLFRMENEPHSIFTKTNSG
jgi:predicted lipoprotein